MPVSSARWRKSRASSTRERRLGAEEFRDDLVDSGLGAWRPVDDLPRLEDMLRGANITVTARLDDASRTLVAVSLYLFSVPQSAPFYERIGMARFADAFWFRRRGSTRATG